MITTLLSLIAVGCFMLVIVSMKERMFDLIW